MLERLYNSFVKVSVAILLVYGLLLIVTASLKTAGIIDKPEIFLILGAFLKKIQYGSVSDWISSLSTFGTLIVAYMAYKAAPDWINRKNVEGGSSIAINFIYRKMNSAEEEIRIVSTCLASMIRLVKSKNGFHAKRKNDAVITAFHKSMVKIANLSDSINASLLELHRFGWNLKDEYNEDLLDFLGNKWNIDIFDENIEYFYYSIEAHKRGEIGDFNDFTLEESIIQFENEVAEFKPLLESWTKAIEKISCASGTYDSFFDINKK
ncbi:hypothetical protein [Pantoea rwandensis]|uniref:Uncharacterized protein n=1 Tax=Pantoea rwandensis TaxID=1076550 RepID=A0A1X1CT74_9GAMM|nr:hypothetical protein [Pantoea rwandensis]ORM67541.1 hypothetical protein HA51_18995 [Pantoea rwandensis]